MSEAARTRKDPAAALAGSYLVEHLRAAASGDPAFFDRAFEAYRLIERMGGMGGVRADAADKSAATGHPLVAAALALLGGRVRHLVDAGLQAKEDGGRVLAEFRKRLAARGLDPASPADRAAAEAEYEKALAAVVPIERSLSNVEAVAEGLDVVNHVVNPKSFLGRRVFEQAWKAVRSFVRDPALAQQVDELHAEIAGRPERLDALARSVREVGPVVVREAYARAAAPTPARAASSRGAARTAVAPAPRAKPKRPATPRAEPAKRGAEPAKKGAEPPKKGRRT